jgi:hypothetical protein
MIITFAEADARTVQLPHLHFSHIFAASQDPHPNKDRNGSFALLLTQLWSPQIHVRSTLNSRHDGEGRKDLRLVATGDIRWASRCTAK